MNSVPRGGLARPETGHWASAFDYCAAACRTTARSTTHENAFISERRYCFGDQGRPKVPVPPAPPLPPSVAAVAGAAGRSCDEACQGVQRHCSPGHVASISDCNSLRTAFMCEAGCGPGAEDSKFTPGYLLGSAQKARRPAYCFTSAAPHAIAAAAAPAFNCSSTADQVRRLCPCEETPGVSDQSTQVDGLEKDGSQKEGAEQRRRKGGGGATGQEGGAADPEESEADLLESLADEFDAQEKRAARDGR